MKYVVFYVWDWNWGTKKPAGEVLSHFDTLEDAKEYVDKFCICNGTYTKRVKDNEIDYFKMSNDEDECTNDYIIYIMSDEEFNKKYGER